VAPGLKRRLDIRDKSVVGCQIQCPGPLLLLCAETCWTPTKSKKIPLSFMLAGKYSIEVCVRENTVFPRKETCYSIPPGTLASTQRQLVIRLRIPGEYSYLSLDPRGYG
jgi:hypothetical protein